MKKLKSLQPMHLPGGFHKSAQTAVRTCGNPMAFIAALAMIVLWLLAGSFFHFGNTWLLVIDTVGNLIAFLMIHFKEKFHLK